MNTIVIPTTGLALNSAKTDLVALRPSAGSSYVKAVIYRTFLAFRGTWRYNLNAGIPYFEQIFVKAPDLAVVRTLFDEALRAVGLRVEKLTVTQTDNETLLVEWIANGDPDSLEI